MRTHRTHLVLAPWSTATPVLDAEKLAAVRVEPVLRRRKGALLLDVTLADGDALTVIPAILVEPAQIVARERDPLIWPAGTPGGDAFASALTQRVLPHLERLALGGDDVQEHVVTFAPCAAFDAARAAGCLGAAPLRDALARLAPYRYAARFVARRRVRIDAADAIGGWAILRERAAVTVAAAAQLPALTAWYGAAPVAADDGDVAIVGPHVASEAPIVVRLDAEAQTRIDVVDPLPLDVDIAFDAAEGPAVRWFAIERAREPELRTPPHTPLAPVGGSAGRIAIVLARPDATVRPGADSDEAEALAAALRAEGFDAAVVDEDALAGADLVHLIGTRDGRRARRVVEAARGRGVPVAVHAHAEAPERGGWWGAEVTRFCFEYADDERDLARYLQLLAQRALTVGAIGPHDVYAPPEAAPSDAAAALCAAEMVYVASDAEGEAVRALGRRGPIHVVAPLVPAAEAPAAAGALVGPDPFVLVHAPIAPDRNQLAVARACAQADVPLVCAGPVADAVYLERVREFGGAGLVLLPEPAPALAHTLRAAAAVVVDAAWVGDGSARLAAAARAGAQLVIADRRPFAAPGASIRRVDPADLDALTRAIGEAWDAALRASRAAPPPIAGLDPGAALRAIVSGYAAAAQAPA